MTDGFSFVSTKETGRLLGALSASVCIKALVERSHLDDGVEEGGRLQFQSAKALVNGGVIGIHGLWQIPLPWCFSSRRLI